LIKVTLYSNDDCSLCDQAIEDLKSLQDRFPHQLAIIDISQDQALQDKYKERVPVLEVGPYVLESPFDLQKLEMTLGAATDRQNQSAKDPKFDAKKKRGARYSGTDRFTHWFSNHYLLVVNLFVLLYVGLPFLAPVLMRAGAPTIARPIYSMYGAVCHQMAFRSWFLFGEQAVYPRLAAEVDGLEAYGSATGLNEGDILAARNYVGNEQVGYKVAYCQRDVAIYAAILAFGLIFALSRRKIPALPWYLWIAFGIAPVAIDGFSQLFSQLPGFPLWDFRESTPFLRSLTGALFGFTTAWFGFPLIEESMHDTRKMLAAKRQRLQQ